jgi:O-antigen/teichoic acid export membrane protein
MGLAGAAAIAQAMALLAAPIITRLYTTEDYGLAASYAALLAVLGPSSSLRYDLAIVLPARDEEAAALYQLSMRIALGFIVIVGLASALTVAAGRTGVVNPGAPSTLAVLMPLSVAAVAGSQIATAWANRGRQYAILARSRVVAGSVVPITAMVTFALAGSNAAGLVAAALAGSVASTAVLAVGLQRANAALPWRASVGSTPLTTIARRHQQFPRYNLPMTLLDQLTIALPVLLLARFFSPSVAAWFALATTTVRLPASLVGVAVSQVFYERAARLVGDPVSLRVLARRQLLLLIAIALPATVIVTAAGPDLFALVFGDAWRQAGTYAGILALPAAFGLMASPLSLLPSVLGLQRTHLQISIIGYAARSGALLVGLWLGSALTVIVLYCLMESAVIVVFIWWLDRRLGTLRPGATPDLNERPPIMPSPST